LTIEQLATVCGGRAKGISIRVRTAAGNDRRGGYLFHFAAHDGGFVLFDYRKRHLHRFDSLDELLVFVNHVAGRQFDEAMRKSFAKYATTCLPCVSNAVPSLVGVSAFDHAELSEILQPGWPAMRAQNLVIASSTTRRLNSRYAFTSGSPRKLLNGGRSRAFGS